jgi:hypothetical protein
MRELATGGDHRKREALGSRQSIRRGALYPSTGMGMGMGMNGAAGDQIRMASSRAEPYTRSQSARTFSYNQTPVGHASLCPPPHNPRSPISQNSLPPPQTSSSFRHSNSNSNSACYPQNYPQQHHPTYRKQESYPGTDREEHHEERESLSILEALELLEEHADDEQDDEDETLTQEPVNPTSPLQSMNRHTQPSLTRSQQSSRSQQLSQFQYVTDKKTGSNRKEESISDWDNTLVAARRPPTTNLGGASSATYDDISRAAPPSINKDDEDLLLAMALQKEEDDYATALREERDRREEDRRQLVMALLEQVPDAHVAPDQVIEYEAPETIDLDEASDFALVNDSSWITEKDICPICLESLSEGLVVSLRQCDHFFHLDCLDDLLQQSRRCPKCRQDVRTQHTGTSPSGTMKITRPVIQRAKTATGSFVEKRVIQIEYILPDGEQKNYHDRPGDPYKGTIKVAYLPTNSQGTYLLKRLIFAFKHGMIFRITRTSDGEKSIVNWASIPHRFSIGEKEFDSIYMANCNEALDQLGVPTSFSDKPASSYS